MTASAFRAPALGAQAVFRTLLDALSRPGTAHELRAELPAPPAGMGAGVYAAALTLVDVETALWLAPEFHEAAADLRFHLGARLVDRPDAAHFALAAAATLPPLGDFAPGDDTYPDRSTTLLVEVADLTSTGPWRLGGPGVAGETRLGVAGLPGDFVTRWSENHARFPRGVDVFLFAGATVVGLPRTTAIAEG